MDWLSFPEQVPQVGEIIQVHVHCPEGVVQTVVMEFTVAYRVDNGKYISIGFAGVPYSKESGVPVGVRFDKFSSTWTIIAAPSGIMERRTATILRQQA